MGPGLRCTIFLGAAAGGLAVATAQLSVHFNNDYFDAAPDQPGSSTFISGGSGALMEHTELQRPPQKCDH
jgi:hypothetical protein